MIVVITVVSLFGCKLVINGSDHDQSFANGWPTLEVVGGCFEDPSGGWGGAFFVATWWKGDGKGNDIEMIQSGAKWQRKR